MELSAVTLLQGDLAAAQAYVDESRPKATTPTRSTGIEQAWPACAISWQQFQM